MGLLSDPYEVNKILLLDVPLRFSISKYSSQTSPVLKRIISPGIKLDNSLSTLDKVFHAVFSGHWKNAVQHWRHMSRVEEKPVAVNPLHVRRIVIKKFRIQNINKICSAHCTTRVTGFGFFYHRCSKNTNVIGCFCFNTFTHIIFYLSVLNYAWIMRIIKMPSIAINFSLIDSSIVFESTSIIL